MIIIQIAFGILLAIAIISFIVWLFGNREDGTAGYAGAKVNWGIQLLKVMVLGPFMIVLFMSPIIAVAVLCHMFIHGGT